MRLQNLSGLTTRVRTCQSAVFLTATHETEPSQGEITNCVNLARSQRTFPWHHKAMKRWSKRYQEAS
jgi:hypothetical protein